MTLDELNGLDREKFAAALGGIFEGSPWVAEYAWDGRPFPSIDALHGAMVEVVESVATAQQLALLRAHPDLGARETHTDAHPAEKFIASKKLGAAGPIDICLEDLGPAPGGTFEGFDAVTVNQHGDLAFGAEIDIDTVPEDPNNEEAGNTKGIFTCKDKQLTTVLLQVDSSKPRGHQWSHELEETSSYGPFVVLLDEINVTSASPDRGVFLVGDQQDPIQGNFKCAGHVDALDILQLLKFEAGVPGISAAAAVCPLLGQPEPRTGFAWGDVNCDGAVDTADVMFFLAVLAGVPKAPSVASCRRIGEVIPPQ